MLPKRWPKWTLVLIAFAVVAGSIVIGLLWEPIGQALSPALTPAPTQVFIKYAAPLSNQCAECHTSQQALNASAESPEKAKAAYIDPTSLSAPHGKLGCITCHGGSPDQESKSAAHVNLIADLSDSHPDDCLICHRNLPAEFPNDNLRTPHGAVVNAAWEGSACGVKCSDCHGAVGHGFDPVSGQNICNMSVCLDCHVAQGLGDTLNDCNVCHVGPHDVALALSCSDCHVSTDTWRDTKLRLHPVSLTGGHAEVKCFTCHRWPNFKGLAAVCSDCHKRTHSFGNDNCALCHTPDGWKASADALVSSATAIPHAVAGREDCRVCHGMVGNQPIPADHKDRTNDTCEVCHVAAPAPAILHPVQGRGSCLACHAEGHVAQFPVATHKAYTEEMCATCHEPSGLTPLVLSHTVEGRDDCVMCHGSGAIKPYPETHTGWGNQLCLLCHQTEATPTKTEHTFPQDHDGAAKNCVLCHPSQDFTTYHCDTCHAKSGMTQVHKAKGISEIENKCVMCHPKGTKP